MIGGQVLPTGYGYQWWLYPGEHGDYPRLGSITNTSTSIRRPAP